MAYQVIRIIHIFQFLIVGIYRYNFTEYHIVKSVLLNYQCHLLIRHANELHVIPRLSELLEPFKTIEDFKILYTEDEQARRSRNPSTSSNCSPVFTATSNGPQQSSTRRARTASEGEKSLK